MGLFTWIREHVLEPIGDLFTSSPEPSPAPTPDEPDLSPPTGDDYSGGTPASSELPPGWVIAGLYHQGEPTTRIHATDVTQVTDSEIHHADAIVVWYVPNGDDGYRWIHGARDWRSVADQIDRVIQVVSPTAE